MPMPFDDWTQAFAQELRRRHASFTAAEALAIAKDTHAASADLTPDEAVEVYLVEDPPLDLGDPAD